MSIKPTKGQDLLLVPVTNFGKPSKSGQVETSDEWKSDDLLKSLLTSWFAVASRPVSLFAGLLLGEWNAEDMSIELHWEPV